MSIATPKKIKLSKWDAAGLSIFERSILCNETNSPEFALKSKIGELSDEEVFQATTIAYRAEGSKQLSKSIDQVVGEGASEAMEEWQSPLMEELEKRMKDFVQSALASGSKYVDLDDINKILKAYQGKNLVMDLLGDLVSKTPQTPRAKKDSMSIDHKNYHKRVVSDASKISLNGRELTYKELRRMKLIDKNGNFKENFKRKFGKSILSGKQDFAASGDYKSMQKYLSKLEDGVKTIITISNSNGEAIQIRSKKTLSNKQIKYGLIYGQIANTERGLTKQLTEASKSKLITFYDKFKDLPKNSAYKLFKKIPIIGSIAGVADAGIDFYQGDYFSGLMGIAGEVGKSVLTPIYTAYAAYDIAMVLTDTPKHSFVAAFDETPGKIKEWTSKWFSSNPTNPVVKSNSKSYLETYAKKNPYVSDQQEWIDCNEKKEIAPINCVKQWSDIYATFVETCTGDFDGGFQYQGEVSVDSSSRTQTAKNQRRDRFILMNAEYGSSDPFIPKLTTEVQSDELVRLWVTPTGLPTWSFVFYGTDYMEARRRCLNKTRRDDDQLTRTQVEKMYLDDLKRNSNTTFVNGVYNGSLKDLRYRIDFGTSSSKTIDITKAEAIRALPENEDWADTMSWTCTESIYPDERKYELELIPMAYS